MKLFMKVLRNSPGTHVIELIDGAENKALDKALADEVSERFKLDLLFSKEHKSVMDSFSFLEEDDLVLLMKGLDMKEKSSNSSSDKAELVTGKNIALTSFAIPKNPSLLSLYNDSLKEARMKQQPRAEKIIPKHQAKGYKQAPKPLQQPR